MIKTRGDDEPDCAETGSGQEGGQRAGRNGGNSGGAKTQMFF